MKRTLKLALTAVIGAALVVPAMAQDNFSDVPDNHWAFEALARMKKEGLLVGYPDGLFRGGRPASRYEMAVALHALFLRIKDLTDSLDSQVKAVDGKIAALPRAGGTTNTGDLDSIRATLNTLQSDVNGMKAWGNNINDLRRLADEFRRELTGLGVNVKDVKDGLGKLEARVKTLEDNQLPFTISGDVNFFVLGTHPTSGRSNIDKDGNTGASNGITDNANVLHELALNIASNKEEGPKWWAQIVLGNTLDEGLTSMGMGYYEGQADQYISKLGVSFDLGFASAKIGRLQYKVSPFLFQRPDTTTYFATERQDNGNYTMDGGVLGFNFGPAKVDVFAGKISNRQTNWGTSLNDLSVGPIDVDRLLGINATLPVSSKGSLNLAYLWLDDDGSGSVPGPNNTTQVVNRANVYGGTLNFSLTEAISLAATYNVSTINNNDTAVQDEDNTAYSVKLGYKGSKFGLYGKYGEVEANYAAPGAWGRLATTQNPTNWKGFTVGGDLALSSALSLSAKGTFVEVKDNTLFGTLNSVDEKADAFAINLGYSLSEALSLNLGYENTKFKRTGADPEYRWTTLGLGYKLGESGKLMLTYEIGDHRNLPFLTSTGNPQGQAKGGLLATQLMLKF